MEEYKSNSHKSKERNIDKKIEKVATGRVRSKKNAGIKKITDAFVSDDVNNVKSYILFDVIIPMIKRAIVEAINIILYGDANRNKKSGMSQKISYRSYYESDDDKRRDTRASRFRNQYDYDELIYDSRYEAEAVIDSMNDILKEYGAISIADLYDISGMENNNYTLNRYGWTDISGTRAVRTSDGYVLTLPKASPLD